MHRLAWLLWADVLATAKARALRSWVDVDPGPDTYIQARVTIPATLVALHTCFFGPVPPGV